MNIGQNDLTDFENAEYFSMRIAAKGIHSIIRETSKNIKDKPRFQIIPEINLLDIKSQY
jgi:hypothetical protein